MFVTGWLESDLMKIICRNGRLECIIIFLPSTLGGIPVFDVGHKAVLSIYDERKKKLKPRLGFLFGLFDRDGELLERARTWFATLIDNLEPESEEQLRHDVEVQTRHESPPNILSFPFSCSHVIRV